MTAAQARTGDKNCRVVQWATGNIGLRSLRAIIEHPKLSLAGLYVYSDAKAGCDAGELCGLPPVGVRATRSIDDILALKADCVLYMPQTIDVDDLCSLLESGSNVVTTRTEFHHPARLDRAVRERIEAACRRGGTSLHSTGSSPGFITEAMPLVLLSLQRRLDVLRIHEYADCSSRDSPEMIFNIMGFGQAPNPQAEAGRAWYLREEFGPSLRVIAEAVGLSFDSVESSGQVALARKRTTIAAGVVEAGTVAAMRTTVSGMRNGKPLMSFTANWFVSYDIDADWKLRGDGWQVEVEGDCPLDMHLHFTVPEARKAATTPGYTAHRAINAVRYVCAAAPGIRTSVELPQIVTDLSAQA
ncbi:NAD(P)H-dependent amine dehydrogenase family protein [Solimonas terrae]|uniref:Dihydrodipicolinate reductase n=1 Tax=Solimonas terrae TaxID=1396819 RepID=A0A6M2BP29_9GAMM|nr:dihydrodipicolinate reductase [Solimonas terrae]NGY03985.1 dihydrodipicolinate reductase [Solimonas terrae]